MGVRLSDEEAWAELAAAHTGILVTLRSDGFPVPLPVWFAVLDHRVYVRTPGRTRKVARVRNDHRASFLVERGEKWAELAAVMMPARATLLDPGEEFDRAGAAISDKYRGFGLPAAKVPDATRKHYAVPSAVIRLEPAGPFVTWDNARLRLG